MIDLKEKSDCAGCAACFSSCNHGAISFVPDEEGFFYPSFATDKCVSCNMCDTTCPIVERKSVKKTSNPSIYVAVNIREEQYLQSSSGGIFILLCEYVLSYKGIVFGAVYDDDFIVRHVGVETIEDCARFCGSKYVQSDIRGVFAQVKTCLLKGRKVLFSGTPCQIEGLKLFLRRKYDNLYTCDVICHGVPSPMIFSDYVRFLSRRKKISSINMKSKNVHKNGTAVEVSFDDGSKERDNLKLNLWSRLYFEHYIVRPSCHDCQFTNLDRSGDITIGDAWGVKEYYPSFYPNKMLSLVITNSEKGIELLEGIKGNIDLLQVSAEEAKQPQLCFSSAPSVQRTAFWTDYAKFGFEYVVVKYLNYSYLSRLKDTLRVLKCKLLAI